MMRLLFFFTPLALVSTGCAMNMRGGSGNSHQSSVSNVSTPTVCLPCDPSNTVSGGGSGSASDPYLVCSVAQLINIDTQCAAQSGWSGSKFVQCSDIDLQGSSGHQSTLLCSSTGFKGSYDGENYAIGNFYYSNATSSDVGLFSHLSGATVSNVTLTNPAAHGLNNVGTLAGRIESDSTVSGCHANGVDVSGLGNDIGGLIGLINASAAATSNTVTLSSSSGTVSCTSGTAYYGPGTGGLIGATISGGTPTYISYSHSSVSVTGNNDAVGGLLGYGDTGTHVDHSYATGTISGSGWGTGGLIGMLDGNPNPTYVSSSYAIGNVSSTGIGAGGLIGFNSWGNISTSYASGPVSGATQVGGLIGGSGWLGASCSICVGSLISSYATGSATGTSGVGGLIGLIDLGVLAVSNSYATGSVSGTSNSGGLIGKVGAGVFAGTTLSDSYSLGAVSGSSGTIGGLVGASSITASSCFWDTTTSGQSTSAVGTAETTAQMKTASTFAGWPTSGANDWSLQNGSYPSLK